MTGIRILERTILRHLGLFMIVVAEKSARR